MFTLLDIVFILMRIIGAVIYTVWALFIYIPFLAVISSVKLSLIVIDAAIGYVKTGEWDVEGFTH